MLLQIFREHELDTPELARCVENRGEVIAEVLGGADAALPLLLYADIKKAFLLVCTAVIIAGR
jgi:hypothetical protein